MNEVSTVETSIQSLQKGMVLAADQRREASARLLEEGQDTGLTDDELPESGTSGAPL